MSVSQIEISKKALLSNIKTFRSLLKKKTLFMAAVKADAYGHGLVVVAPEIEDKVDWFGVDNLEEALEIRALGIRKPVLVLGFIPEESLAVAVKNDISFVVYHKNGVVAASDAAKKAGKKAKLHLKIETGTNRQGMRARQIPGLVKELKRHKEAVLEGVYTHFANIEDTLDPSFATLQLERFEEALSVLKKHEVEPKLRHAAATAGTLLYPQTHFDMVRVGIGLYGLWPSRETRLALKVRDGNLKLLPVLTWKTQVVQVKNVPAGESVSYGRTWWTSRNSRLAIIPVGYSDGYERLLSNKGKVLVRGEFAPVVGRVMMNMIVVDVTDIPGVHFGDEVVLIGKQGKNEITVDYLAELTGTINYEVVSRLNSLIPRKLV